MKVSSRRTAKMGLVSRLIRVVKNLKDSSVRGFVYQVF